MIKHIKYFLSGLWRFTLVLFLLAIFIALCLLLPKITACIGLIIFGLLGLGFIGFSIYRVGRDAYEDKGT
jgi:hypothetical protein